MKMMKNIMALALAFTFVFVGAQDTDAYTSKKHDFAGMANDFASCTGSSCHSTPGTSDGVMPPVGFAEGDVCTSCHVETENGHGYSGQGTPEKPHAAHGGHNVYVDDAEKGGYDDCVGCHVNPANATDANGDGLITGSEDPDGNAGPYVPAANGKSYLTPHSSDGVTSSFKAEDCGMCHEGAVVPATETTDPDHDGLTNDVEAELGYDTNVADVDTDFDGDGMTDLEEVNYNAKKKANLDPKNEDSDGDGALDGEEVDAGCDPTVDDMRRDPDSDGLNNEDEIANGTQAKDADTDDDGLYDGYEVVHSLDPLSSRGIVAVPTEPVTVTLDPTTGEVSDTVEMDSSSSDLVVTEKPEFGRVKIKDNKWTYTLGDISELPQPLDSYDVTETDTFVLQYVDLNGAIVSTEVNVEITVTAEQPPVDADYNLDNDNDGLTNGEEADLGTDPNKADTDGDGIYDAYDANPLTPDSTEPVDPAYGVEAPAPVDPITPVNPEEGTDGEGTNPETGSGSLMFAFGAVTAATAGLVAVRRRK